VRMPKSVLLGLTLVAAAFLAWMVRSSVGEMGGAQTSADPVSGQTAPAGPPSAQHAGRANRPIHITVVIDDSGVRAVATEEGAAPASSSARRSDDVALLSSGQRRTFAAGSPSSISTPWSAAAASSGRQVVDVAPTSTGAWRTSNAVDMNNGTVNAQVQGPAIIANGDHIVIATSGSIVSVGDNTVVKGNTGNAGASGVIAIDVANSALTSGNSSVAAPLPTGSATTPTDWTTTDPPGSFNGGGSPVVTAGSVAGGSAAAPGTRAVGIAGWQMHNIDVSGNDNFATYNDSDLFFQRSGMLNGNTGDTSTSGLHVVDSVGSRVRSGSSLNARQTPVSPPFDPASLASSPAGALATPTAGGGSVSVADGNGLATANAQDSFVIGGAGVSDSSVGIRGDRNAVTYDDGNAAIGGTGDVNAQVGNSDTAGTAVMHVRSSDIAAGNSLLTSPQPISPSAGDPNDLTHPDFGAPTTPAVP
jgi:hypothetical protein